MSAPWTHTYACKVAGTPTRVFAALVEPEALRRWFAEYVDIEPRPDGAYRFWGKHTYGLPDSHAATQRITRFEPGQALGFTWSFAQIPTEVTLEVSAVAATADAPEERTAVALRHVFSARPNVPYDAELVDDLWRLTLGNLDAHLRGGSGITRPDYADPSPEIRTSIVIDAPRAKVFRALVDPAGMNRWIAKAADVDPRVGGRYVYGWRYKHGSRDVEGGPTTILELVENERLVTDWLDWRGDTTRGSTRIAWLLEDAGSGTKVTLVHSGFSRAADVSDYPFGWGWFLQQLKKASEDEAC